MTPTDISCAEAMLALEDSGAWRNPDTGLWTWHPRSTKPENIFWHSDEDALTITRACLYLGAPVTDVVSGKTWLRLIDRVRALEALVNA